MKVALLVSLSYWYALLCHGDEQQTSLLSESGKNNLLVSAEMLQAKKANNDSHNSNLRRKLKKSKKSKSPSNSKSPKKKKKKKKCKKRKKGGKSKSKSKSKSKTKSPNAPGKSKGKSKKSKASIPFCDELDNVLLPVTLGEFHTCVGGFEDGLSCWGFNQKGQLGDGTNRKQRSNPTPISFVNDSDSNSMKQIVLGYSHTCIIDNDDDLKCWGNNDFGQLGDGTTTNQNTPTTISLGSDSSSATKIALGYEHTCTIDSLDNLKCWGNNDFGQLGDGGTTQQNTPKIISLNRSGVYATEVALGYHHSCIIDSDRRVSCWGGNDYGQLGDGTTEDLYVPTRITLGNTNSAKEIAAGDYYSCVIDVSENLICWGRNNKGQLGDGTTTQRNTPTIISLGTGDVSPIAIALGGSHTCAIDNLDNLKCWGWNKFGQLGDGKTTDSTELSSISLGSPGTFATSIALGRYHTCAMDNLENLMCWGANERSQVGGGEGPDTVLTPKVILGPKFVPSKPLKTNAPSLVPEPKPVTRSIAPLTLGEHHTCSRDEKKKLRCWGSNIDGQIGDGLLNRFRSYPTKVLLGKDIIRATQIALGYSHTCTINNNEDLKCWGNNDFGQLGDGTTTNQNTPTTISLGSDSSSATKIALGYKHTCTIDSLDNLKCWGRNNKGQLGDGGTSTQQNTPTIISIGTGSVYATKMALGYHHSCIIDSDRRVSCWGGNDYGQLGDGTIDNVSTPKRITLGPNTSSAKEIAAGDYYSCVIDRLDKLYCWGRNNKGQLGDGTTTQRNTPTIISLGTANVFPIAIALGGSHTCAIDNLDNLKCWGWNQFGQLGDGKTIDRNIKTLISLGSGNNFAINIALGRYHTCAMDNSETLLCWGHNNYGQIGDGTKNDNLTPKVVL